MYINKFFQISILALSVVGCSSNASSQSGQGQSAQAEVVQIDATEFTKMSTDSNTIIIDVRTPGEVASGYIPGTKYFIDINGSSFETQIEALDTNKTYLVYCRSGARSGRAADFMVSNGFKKVYNLQGGIMNWPGEIKKD